MANEAVGDILHNTETQKDILPTGAKAGVCWHFMLTELTSVLVWCMNSPYLLGLDNYFIHKIKL